MKPKKAAICFDTVTIFFGPKNNSMTGPEILGIKDYVRLHFKKVTLNIRIEDDLAPVTLPICGHRNKVVVFKLQVANQVKMQRMELEVPDCPAPPDPDSGSKSQPGIVLALMSFLIIVFY